MPGDITQSYSIYNDIISIHSVLCRYMVVLVHRFRHICQSNSDNVNDLNLFKDFLVI